MFGVKSINFITETIAGQLCVCVCVSLRTAEEEEQMDF